MELASVVIALALIEYSVFGALVGKARIKYGVKAPAVTGHPVFERYYRVQQNTLEVLIIFIPGMFLFASYVHANAAAAIGLVFIAGRLLYCKTYLANPKSRGPGFALSFISAQVLVWGGLIGVVVNFF
jgi:glutathione S-transferase